MPDQQMTQGQRLRQLRKQKRYTMDYVASQLNTTKQTIYKYETDLVHNIPLDKLRRLGALYGCSPAYLQGLTDEPGKPPAGESIPVDAPNAVPEEPAVPETADAQLTCYRDLMDTLLRLTPAQRNTVLQFARFLAADAEQ